MPGSFRWDDPFLLDEQLSDEERMVRDVAHEYCQDKLMPRILHANRSETFDRSIYAEMAELGMLGATLPEEYRRRRAELRQLRLDRPRSRARRQQLSQRNERAEFIGHVSHLCLWHAAAA